VINNGAYCSYVIDLCGVSQVSQPKFFPDMTSN